MVTERGAGAAAVTAALALSWASCAPPASRPDPAPGAGAPPELTVALGGDVMFGRWIDGTWHDHEEPEPLALLAGADVAVVNLETALCEAAAARTAAVASAHRFAAPPERAARLASAGVDVAVVANNHAMDCGPESLVHTARHLGAAGIGAAGIRPGPNEVQQPVRVRVRPGMAVSVLAFTFHPPRVAPGDRPRPDMVWDRQLDAALATVRAARSRHLDDALVVSLHWGAEHAPEPAPWQRSAARALIDAGADLIFGHGAHVLHEVETHRGALVAYGLGNLHFDMARADSRDRVVAHVGLRRRQGRWRAHDLALCRSLPCTSSGKHRSAPDDELIVGEAPGFRRWADAASLRACLPTSAVPRPPR